MVTKELDKLTITDIIEIGFSPMPFSSGKYWIIKADDLQLFCSAISDKIKELESGNK